VYDVYDSSVWIWGLTEQAPDAVSLVEDVLHSDFYVAVSAYIHGEVMAAFDSSRTADSQAIKDAKNAFNAIIAKRHNVDFPDQSEVGKMNIYEVREQHMVQLLASSWEIQPKDVPIVVFADRYDDNTIFTADEQFSKFDPADHGINGIDIEYVPTP
jgi:predicted nucleic acid-binding protein